MPFQSAVAPWSLPTPDGMSTDTDPVHNNQNVQAVLDFYSREDQKISRYQRLLERISQVIGTPAYLAFILVSVLFWVSVNRGLSRLGRGPFDPAPYFWLQGLIGLGALLTMTVILAKQNRLSSLADQRAHLDLTVTLLTEQKTAKLIDLVEELRRDMPSVRDRHDPEASALKQSLSPNLVLAVLEKEISPAQHLQVNDGAGEPTPVDHPHSD